MLYTLAMYGGHVLAAMDGQKIVGLLVGLLGTNVREPKSRPAMANLVLASKRMVVLPEYRGEGIGLQLKLAQRDRAIKQGVRLVTWTFDPLLSVNAHLNLRKLATVSQLFHENLYGTRDDNGLTTLGRSDRLRVDWWVTSRRVEERLNGSRVDLRLAQYLDAGTQIVNPTVIQDGFAIPPDSLVECAGSFALLEIPLNFPTIVEADPTLARRWQDQVREGLKKLFASGYVVTDFLRDEYQGRVRGFYLMSFDMGFDFSLN
jgi:predicted GNAT superfamily acetyltransferase